jgi:hypothetical protein
METRHEDDVRYMNQRRRLLKDVIERHEEVEAKLDEYMFV